MELGSIDPGTGAVTTRLRIAGPPHGLHPGCGLSPPTPARRPACTFDPVTVGCVVAGEDRPGTWLFFDGARIGGQSGMCLLYGPLFPHLRLL
jgi:hypothetical protein